MLKLVFDVLSKERILPVVFFTAFVILVLIRSPIQAVDIIGKTPSKIASPLPLTTQTPILTPAPTLKPTLAPTLIPSPIPTKIPLPTLTPTPTSAPAWQSPLGGAKLDPKSPDNDLVWENIAACETNGNWSSDTGNGYFGGLQFSQGAWNSVGGSGNPAQASKDEQITRGKMLKNLRGWGVWGACAQRLGLN